VSPDRFTASNSLPTERRQRRRAHIIQPTPLCGPTIGGILKTRSGPSAFPLDHSGAADAGPLTSAMRDPSDACVAPVDVMMRRPTLVGVPALPILAAPLVVRRAHVEEAGALAALLGRTFEAETWEAAGTERELFGDETIRATVVVAAAGRLVATASLQVRPDAPECGWVRWVATELDRRREGLARTVVIGVLALAEQAGCREARLRTQTDRLAAIPLYVQLGFEPLVRSDGERAVWERVIRLLSGEAGGGRVAPPAG
jgi:mycothiol synthase